MTQLSYSCQLSFWEKVGLFSPLLSAWLVETEPGCCHHGNQHTPGTDARQRGTKPRPTSAAGIAHSTILAVRPAWLGTAIKQSTHGVGLSFDWPWFGYLTDQRPRRLRTMDVRRGIYLGTALLLGTALATAIGFWEEQSNAQQAAQFGKSELTPAQAALASPPAGSTSPRQVEYISRAVGPGSDRPDGPQAIDDPQVVPASYEQPDRSGPKPSAPANHRTSRRVNRPSQPSSRPSRVAKPPIRATNRPSSGPLCLPRCRRSWRWLASWVCGKPSR